MENELTQWLKEYLYYVIAGTFFCIAIIESFSPRSVFDRATITRWTNNGAFFIITVAIGRLISPLAVLFSAYSAEQLEWGLFQHYETNILIVALVGILSIDMVSYWVHRLYHHIDALWNIHKVHHCDIDLDITSGWRFHPFESLLNAVFRITVIALLGLPFSVVLLSYVLTSIVNYFSHARINLPKPVLKLMQLVFITPTIHRIHHTVPREDHDNNYGVIFSIWDRLFGTLITEPSSGNSIENIGISQYRDLKDIGIWPSLMMPFRWKATTNVQTGQRSPNNL